MRAVVVALLLAVMGCSSDPARVAAPALQSLAPDATTAKDFAKADELFAPDA